MVRNRKFAGLTALAGAFVVLAGPPRASAQGEAAAPAPYASIKSNQINYRGPGREASFDLTGSTLRIGLMVPLQGAQKPDGEAIVAAARLALEDDAARGLLPAGRRLALAVGDESGPSWGHASSALIRLVMDDQAIAVVTSANGSTAHLSEQVGNRIGVAILTLASDKTTTQIDLPWIFRLAPSDTEQAQTMAQDIYRAWGYQRVLLVMERGHDGRLGGGEFARAHAGFNAPAPLTVSVDPLKPDAGPMLDAIRAQSPAALVFWTSSSTARVLLQALRQADISLPAYLSQQAAQARAEAGSLAAKAPAGAESSLQVLWTCARPPATPSTTQDFARRFQALTGAPPSAVAAEAYDAVRLVAQSVRAAGANRARVRDRIAGVRNFAGVSGTISFDLEGNSRGEVQLVRLR